MADGMVHYIPYILPICILSLRSVNNIVIHAPGNIQEELLPSTMHLQSWAEPHIHVSNCTYRQILFLPHLKNITYHPFAPQL